VGFGFSYSDISRTDELKMKILVITIIFCLIIFGAFTPAWASVELNAYLPISGDPVTPEFKFSKLVTLTYPLGGKLKSLLEGQNKTISFSEEADKNPSVKALMEDINAQLATGTQAITTLTNLRVDYQAKVTGGSYHTDIEYYVTLTPTLTNYVLNQGQGDNPTVLDASWMSFVENGPVIITTEYGDLDINYLIGFIKSQLPDVYYAIKGTGAETALQQNLIDSRPLLYNSLDKWDSLFDPAYTLTQTGPVGEVLNKVAVTTFASGLSSLEQNHATRIGGSEFSSDTDYHLDITETPNSGTINVEGHANANNLLGKWTFSTMINLPPSSPHCCPLPWNDIAWVWVGVAAIAAIGFGIFYLRRFRRRK
jgi:hypothetical protein